MKADRLLVSLALICACVPPEDDPSIDAPAPIGEELLSFTTALGIPGCGRAHLYRAQRAVQYQCFATDGSFSWENRGTLSPDGTAALDAAIADADFDNTEPGPDDGFCGGPESDSASMTLWAAGRSFTYAPACPTMGIAALHDVAMTLIGDMSDCMELDLLDSVEPGCRAY